MKTNIGDWRAVYGSKLRSFLNEVYEWNPDFIVPVGRKCAKLFRVVDLPTDFHKRVFYKEYFDFLNVPLRGRKIAIVDDSVRHGSALRKHRDHFMLKDPQEIRTFAFVGHMGLKDGSNISYEPRMKVHVSLSEPAYQDYLMEQAELLLSEGFYQDVDHLVLEIDLGPAKDGLGEELFSCLEKTGYAYPVRPFRTSQFRFSVVEPDFFLKYSEMHPKGAFFGGINKLRFHIAKDEQIICVPMSLPRLHNEQECSMLDWATPFKLPCQIVRSSRHHMDQLCYWSSSLLLSTDLGRTLILFLKSRREEFPELVDVLDNIKVRKVDFVRYLGEDIAESLIANIKQSLLSDNKPSKDLIDKLNANLIHQRKGAPHGTLTNGAEGSILDHLRAGYERKVKAAKTRVGVHYTLPLDELEKIGNASPTLLMEMLDSLCDSGVLVPVVDPNEKPLERRWRTGEPDYDSDWKRNSFLIPLAIQTIAEEIRESKINAMLLMKVLANFVYDYPRRLPFCRLHCLKRDPYVDGTIVKIHHQIRAKIPISIYDFRNAGNRYEYRRDENTAKAHFSTTRDVLDDPLFDKLFNNDQRIPVDEIIAYFAFLGSLSRKFGNIDVLTGLSVCRSRDTFLWHLHENVRLWTRDFGAFLENLNIPYSEDVKEGPLHRSGHSVDAGLRKIWLWRGFDALLKEIRSRSAEIRYKKALKTIMTNIEEEAERDIPVLSEYEGILSLQQALTGMMISKHMSETLKSRTTEEVEKWAFDILDRNGTPIDSSIWKQVNDVQSIKHIVEPIYYQIYQRVKALSMDYEEETERERLLFERAARNRAVEIVKENAWSHPTFVHLDLSGFRTAGDRASELIAKLYNVADNHSSNFGGYCVTPDPGGNDYLLYAFPATVVALRMAAKCVEKFESDGMHVKFGISETEVSVSHEYETLVTSMGLCKDLCEFEGGEGHRNVKDVFVSSNLLKHVTTSDLSYSNYFEEIVGETVEYKLPKNTDTLKVYKFNWKQFLNDRR